ncbi:hypothetical protein NSU_4442 [Novosphingobium pentaromativorans US6-1]|uniref:Uncharacterized protein n=1 Tax=Novosphingobium pentaromativorans US6-1 TaxID=1088721 RepID=G6EJC1_9SPHN|nr:hypothetical protein NSU_4442 [Novosphingobium pentaromativorans US6-1]
MADAALIPIFSDSPDGSLIDYIRIKHVEPIRKSLIIKNFGFVY